MFLTLRLIKPVVSLRGLHPVPCLVTRRTFVLESREGVDYFHCFFSNQLGALCPRWLKVYTPSCCLNENIITMKQLSIGGARTPGGSLSPLFTQKEGVGAGSRDVGDAGGLSDPNNHLKNFPRI